MKKVIFWLLISSAVVLGCARKLVPDSDGNISSGQEKKAEKEMGKEDKKLASNSSDGRPSFNNMQQSVSPSIENSISLDKGKTIFVTKCGGCHALKTPGDYTSDQINAFLKTEISRAKLDKKDADQLSAYLFANAKK